MATYTDPAKNVAIDIDTDDMGVTSLRLEFAGQHIETIRLSGAEMDALRKHFAAEAAA